MANKLDLIGKTFNQLTVIREADKKERTNIQKRSWICQCSCGNITQVETSHLTSGHTKSCGCYREKYNQSRRVDYIGKTFNRLTVLKDADDKNGKRQVECKCVCGTIKIVSLADLKAGKIISCGCWRNEQIKQAVQKKDKIPTYRDDLKDKIFGCLKVLEFDPEFTLLKRTASNKRSYWKCQCQCGNIVSIAGSSLKTGLTQSCGCLQKERSKSAILKAQRISTQQLTAKIEGQRFGLLTVIELDQERSGQGNGSFWKCRCDCGNEKSISYTALKSGNTLSCGCLKMSIGEYIIDNILKDNKINYQREITFADLYDNGPLRFDFGIFQNNKLVLLIEYDGKQHFDTNNPWHTDTLKKHDLMKDEYCQKNNLPLLRIPYSIPKENITLDFLLSKIS